MFSTQEHTHAHQKHNFFGSHFSSVHTMNTFAFQLMIMYVLYNHILFSFIQNLFRNLHIYQIAFHFARHPLEMAKYISDIKAHDFDFNLKIQHENSICSDLIVSYTKKQRIEENGERYERTNQESIKV